MQDLEKAQTDFNDAQLNLSTASEAYQQAVDYRTILEELLKKLRDALQKCIDECKH